MGIDLGSPWIIGIVMNWIFLDLDVFGHWTYSGLAQCVCFGCLDNNGLG